MNYENVISHILEKGVWKDNRTGVKCLTVANTMFQHDMADGFPLSTTRKLPIKSTMVELEGFLKGITSKVWYQERGCKYWDYWANPKEVEKAYSDLKVIQGMHGFMMDPADPVALEKDTKNRIQQKVDDLGPIYGYQWRRYGEHYPEVMDMARYMEQSSGLHGGANGMLQGADQLHTILSSLTNNPNDRRMLCSAWNPNQMSMMALPPCHFAWGVIHLNGVLNLWWTQRSVDSVCGLPQNIASYATLLLLLCKQSGFKPGTLTGYLCDTHIYENHMDGIKEQLSREKRGWPTLEITGGWPFEFYEEEKGLHVNWTHKDIELTNYDPHPPIKFEVAV